METMGSEKDRMPTFDGKKEKFETWKMRWEAFTIMENLSSDLGVNGDPDITAKHDDVIDVATTKVNAHMKANTVNMRAVAYYTMTMKSVRLMAFINKSKTVEWPGGLEWNFNQSMIKKYRPTHGVAQSEMCQRLNALSMKKNEDPETLFEQLAEIEAIYNGMGKTIDQDDMVTVVLTAAPKD
jgi:hypothetical protein